MKDFSFPLAVNTWNEREYEALQKVMASGQFTMGPMVKQFENAFAKYIGSNFSIMVNSGSSANLLMIAALFYTKDNPLKEGDEVIVPALSWSTTYFPLQQYGLKIKFVDVDLNTLNFDLEALKNAISDETRLILAVNLLGNPNDFDRIAEIIKGKNIQLIEDNCESLGAKFKGKNAGTFGRMGTFSSYFSHHISTMEGGLIVTDSEELFHILLSLRSHGWTRHLPKINYVTGIKSDEEFDESFKFVLPGYNVRPLEFSGAVGIAQLEKLDKMIFERRKNAEYFLSSIRNNRNFITQSEVGESSWFGFSLILSPDNIASRKTIIEILERKGVECRPIVAGNFLDNPVCKYLNYEVSGELKNASYISKKGFFVGNQPSNLKRSIDHLLQILG